MFILKLYSHSPEHDRFTDCHGRWTTGGWHRKWRDRKSLCSRQCCRCDARQKHNAVMVDQILNNEKVYPHDHVLESWFGASLLQWLRDLRRHVTCIAAKIELHFHKMTRWHPYHHTTTLDLTANTCTSNVELKANRHNRPARHAHARTSEWDEGGYNCEPRTEVREESPRQLCVRFAQSVRPDAMIHALTHSPLSHQQVNKHWRHPEG